MVRRTRYPVVARAMHPDTRYYVAPDNVFNGKTFASVAAVWDEVFMPFKPGVAEANRATDPPITVPGYAVKPAADVEAWVLASAGVRPADRDPVDTRIIDEVRTGKGTIIASQKDVGGWPDLAERRRTLTVPADPSGDDDGDGYTNLEEWLHGFAADMERDRGSDRSPPEAAADGE